tara:strand:+ start:295 stop:570 length:276 start_codon:yes stop_codon:yes gene_type:complete
MRKLELELKTLQFKYDLLKKVQEKIPELMVEEMKIKEEELQMWKSYACKQKPREDRMRKTIQHYINENKKLSERVSNYKQEKKSYENKRDK